mmetsp:Transcript_792/g.1070  ORF Transcript_792/g.1070 Transcript_792/m.1070 type:complete len:234 (+) Transcript_792:375-1076(+)
MVTTFSQDDNRDGKLDRLEFGLQMPLTADETIQRVTAILSFDVTISKKAKYNFDAVAYFNYDSGSALATIYADGDLVLRQTQPLSSKGGFKVPYKSESLFPSTTKADLSISDISLQKIMQRSCSRNLSMVYRTNYVNAIPQSLPVVLVDSLASKFNADRLIPKIFNVSLIIRIPQQPIRYVPSTSVILTNAWVIFMSFFVFIGFILYRLTSFIFRHQLLTTFQAADLVAGKLD